MKWVFTVLLITISTLSKAQSDTLSNKKKPTYMRKEEIIYRGKRYAIHNNYISLGGGYLSSSIRYDVQNAVGADYQFHIRRLQFQAGAMMSGEDFFSNNNTQAHIGYGYRRETNTANFSVYAGPMYFTGVEGYIGSPAQFYDGFGAYFSAQAIYKPIYDIGFGVEVFGDISYKQSILGVKFIAFFSGAYRGVKRNYNPNVRAESGK